VARSEILRALALILLVGLFITILAMINRPSNAPVLSETISAPVRDDLSAELRRCSVLGPQDPDDAACRAAWAESHRRFFNLPTRQVISPAAPASSEFKGAVR